MSALLVALLLFPLAQVQNGASTTGNAQTGKAVWQGPNTLCQNCHGVKGEGGFGPDLTGRQLGVERFRQAVRKPSGVMPAFTEQQLSDRDIADLVAYFDSQPKVAAPGPWRTAVPAGAPTGQKLLIATFGCGQCHGAALAGAPTNAGAVGADYAWFAKMVYDHTTAEPEHRILLGDPSAFADASGGLEFKLTQDSVRMGTYSREQLPETDLQEIWRYVSVDVGIRALIAAQMSVTSAGVPAGNGVTYTLTVENRGLPGKGLTAKDVSIALTLPSGAKVVSASGAGYQGVRRAGEANADLAVWQVPRIDPKDKQTYTITLSGGGAAPQIPRGTVRWSKPAQGEGSLELAHAALPAPPQQTR